MAFFRMLMVGGIRIFKVVLAALKMTFRHNVIVHSRHLTISRQNGVCSLRHYPHHSALYKDVPFVTYGL